MLIVDDSDLPKTGLRMECIGKIFSHVFQRCILGYKLLALCWSDGRSQFVVDFSIHGERGKVDGKEQGLTARQRERRYNRKRDRDCQTEKRKEEYRQQKDKLEIEAMRRNPETAYLVDKEAFDNKLDELGALDAIEACGMYVDRAMYNMKKSVQNFFRELLELMFNAAALVVDTLRTFFLIVLSILGPISFAISCWDGFQASLSQWFVRYISIYLWLPVSDLFSSVLARIQTLMLQRDIEQLSNPNFIPDSSNAVYITFLIIGIIGYFTIPTVANWIVQAGGGAGNYGKNVNQAASKTGSIVGGAAGATVGNVAGRLIK